MSTRTGKIARLAKPVRDQVNHWLDDGASAPAVIEKLAALGHTGLNEQNISNWRQGGYEDWLEDRARMEAIKIRAEASIEYVKMVQESGSSLEEANALMLASQINELLQSIELTTIKELLTDDPRKFFDLVNAVTSQSNERTKREKLELELEKHRDAMRSAAAEVQKLRDPQGNLNDAERAAIVAKVDEILGLK